MIVSMSRFNALVREEVDSLMETLSADLVEQAGGVIVSTVEKPSREQMDTEEDRDMLGLFEGRALTERHVDDLEYLPPRITLFHRSLAGMCRTEKELRREIRLTLVHEFAHFFGFSEKDLEERQLD